jgi:hypothetical protein
MGIDKKYAYSGVVALVCLFAFTTYADGLYRKFTVTGITVNQARAFRDDLGTLDLTGVRGRPIGYKPDTQTLEFSVHIDTEDLLLHGVTVAELRTRARTYIQNKLGKFPDIDVAVTDGSTGLTGRDRCRQFIATLQAAIDPRTIGVEATTDSKAARDKVLMKYAKACKAHWGM